MVNMKPAINESCKTCKYIFIDYDFINCRWCRPCEKFGICQKCCVDCHDSVMWNQIPRYHKKLYDIFPGLMEYIHQNGIWFTILDTIMVLCIFSMAILIIRLLYILVAQSL